MMLEFSILGLQLKWIFLLDFLMIMLDSKGLEQSIMDMNTRTKILLNVFNNI
jgi:hypothetical protein